MSGRERSSIKRTVACATGKLCSSHLSGYRSGGFCRRRMHSFNKRTHFGYAYFIFVTSSAALTRFFCEKLATPSRCSLTEVSVDDGCTVLKNVLNRVRFFHFRYLLRCAEALQKCPTILSKQYLVTSQKANKRRATPVFLHHIKQVLQLLFSVC